MSSNECAPAGSLVSVNYSLDTLIPMLALVAEIQQGRSARPDLEARIRALLRHPDYQVEFARYRGRVSEEEFLAFLLDFQAIDRETLVNKDFQARYDHLSYLFSHIPEYCQKLGLIPEIFTHETVQGQLQMALNGLPANLQLGEITFLFTIGIGMSFGYPFTKENGKTYIHFDFVQLVRDFTPEQIKYCIGHEIHHIGMNKIHDSLDLEKMSLENLYLLLFSGEGLAVKYCNNAEGKWSKSLYAGLPPHIGLDEFSWEYLLADYDNTKAMFFEHLRLIRTGQIATQAQLMALFEGYWMNDMTDGQAPGEPPQLKQTRLYCWGSEIWGIIHDAFGKGRVYELIAHMEEFLPAFNRALELLHIPAASLPPLSQSHTP